MHRVFHIDEIVRLIVFSLAEDARGDMLEGWSDEARRSKTALARFARVCRRFYPIAFEGLLLDLHDHQPLLSLYGVSKDGTDSLKRDIITRKSRSVWFRRVDLEWCKTSVRYDTRDPLKRITLPGIHKLSWTCGAKGPGILDISALNLPYLREICVRGVWDDDTNSDILNMSSQPWRRLRISLNITMEYPEIETLRIRWDEFSEIGSLRFFEAFPSYEKLKNLYLVVDCIGTESAVVLVAKLSFLIKPSIKSVHRRSATSLGTMREATEGFQSLQCLILEEIEDFICGFIRAMPSCPLTELDVRVQDYNRSSTQDPGPSTNLAELIVERFGSLQKLYVKSAYPSVFSEEFFASLCRLGLVTVRFSGVAAELLTPELYEMMAKAWPRLEKLEICVHREPNSAAEIAEEKTDHTKDSAILHFKDRCPRLHSFRIQ